MVIHTKQGAARWLRRVGAAALGAAAALGGGCSSLLDVDNPNNVGNEALDNPAVAQSLVNGAETATVRALTAILAPYGTASDELAWVGSRDAYNSLDLGDVSDVNNEFVDAAIFYVHEGRWLADNAVTKLQGFDEAGTLQNRLLLARAYFVAAENYTYVPDMFDDFTISDRTEAGPPIGEANMASMYDQAVEYADLGIAVAREVAAIDEDAEEDANQLEGELQALKARALFSKAIWAKVNPVIASPGLGGLVTSPEAVAAADAAIALLGTTDWKVVWTPSTSMSPQGFPIYGNEINIRSELRFGGRYVNPNPANQNRTVSSQKITDPLSGALDPVYATYMNNSLGKGDEVPITIVSMREMLLIKAEDALARGATAEFDTFINQLRALNSGLPAYTGAGISRLDLLIHSRDVNLYMQGRRMADLYRFGLTADLWTASSPAVRIKGCFFPITVSERQANEIVDQPASCQD